MEILLISVLELLFGLVALLAAYYAWQHREKPSGVPVFALLVAGTLYAVVNGLESLLTNELVTELLGYSRWILGAVIAVFVFYTAVEFCGQEQFKRPNVLLALGGFLVLDAILVLTNPVHSYFLVDVAIENGVLVYSPGPLLWIHLLVSFGFVIAGITLLGRKLTRHVLYRKQTAAMILGVGIAAGFFVVESAITIHPAFNIATVGIISGSAVLLWAITNAKLLETVPIARETLMDSMDAIIFAVDLEDTIIDINRSGREVLDVDEEVIGKNATEMLSDYPEMVAEFKDETDAEHEFTLKENGQTKHYFLRISPITYTPGFGTGDRQSTLVGRLVVVTDVTERRRRERELDLLKQVFARVLRHNMRNDLNVILGTAELLEERVDQENRPLVEKISESTGDIMELSEKARDLQAIIESPREKQIINLTESIHGAVDDVEKKYPDSNISIEGDNDCYIFAHPALETALKNIVENGCEHQNPPDRTVEISVESTDSETEIVIEDDGPGISAHEIDVIHSEAETTLRHGSGLGLWIVNWVVNRSDAVIEISSTENGTTVSLRFETASPPDEKEMATHRTAKADNSPQI